MTGSSRGLGRSVIEAAFAAGDSVIAATRGPDQDIKRRSEESDRTLHVQMDVKNSTDVTSAVEEAMRWRGRIDILAHCAGIGMVGALEEATDDQIRRIFEVNVHGAIAVTKAVLPHFRGQHSGHIIHVSSTSGVAPKAGGSIYAGTKWAVEGISEALAQEVRPHGIRVTLVEPGAMETEFLDQSTEWTEAMNAYGGSVGKARRLLRSRSPVESLDPNEVANLIVQIADMSDPPLRIPVGVNALRKCRGYLESRLADLDAHS